MTFLYRTVLYDHVMGNLRQAVAQLEENELFEQTLRRGSQAALQIQPSTNDIDALMRSMMSGDNMPIRKQRKNRQHITPDDVVNTPISGMFHGVNIRTTARGWSPLVSRHMYIYKTDAQRLWV